jgi:N-acetylneuraminic acid mutarotase
MRNRIRIFGVVSWLFLLGATAYSAESRWTWVRGNSAMNQSGLYGTLRVGAPANTPGARIGMASWKDKSGRFWIFGGYGYDNSGTLGYLNDLWRFDPVAGNWTWVKGGSRVAQPVVYGTQGQAAPDNTPVSRVGAAAWTDPAGRLWLFGGYSLENTSMRSIYDNNDLWCFDPATNNWTWIKGSSKPNQFGTYGTLGRADPANTPGARTGPTTWTDQAGRLWLFGGVCCVYDGRNILRTELNDLWRFDPASGNWTWMKGSSTSDQSGVYGVKGVAAPGNTPGSRSTSSSWTDKSGRFWLFGGGGATADPQPGFYGLFNDLWCFDPATNNWTWINGSDYTEAVGVYGNRGVADPANVPGARDGAVTWTDNTGRFWLYGGITLGRSSGPEPPPFVNLSDLWCYDPVTNNWTWVKGSQQFDEPAVYGVRGQAAAANTPGAREDPVGWADNYGRFWLFGGGRYQYKIFNNDLWMITRPNAALTEAWKQYP